MSIELGSELPIFELKNQNGILFSSKTIKANKALVVFFYPKNFTPTCTKEACGFRDVFEIFLDQDITVIGISVDNVASHKRFAKKYNIPFMLLADTQNIVRNLFKIKKQVFGILPGRETFVFNKKGILVSKYKSLHAQQHINGALNLLH